jgi:hypothetical protein
MRWLCVATFWLFPLLASADSGYLDELIHQSRRQALADHPEWRRLLHYEPRLLLPGVESLVDSSNFFHSPRGKFDPQAELDATLASFFLTVEETPERQHPQCAFVARYHWLKRHLNFDARRLPPQPCARFNDWRRSLDAHEITLVFPAAFLNSPASMYGHTLLRVDAKSQNERTRLLAYSISYAATTDETNGLIFAVKGLFGGYPGKFSTAPYYLKVREYTDIENRDIWEYRLNLTAEEIDRLLMHVWELGPTYFDYYFFDENCAYHLLSLLEVARPGLKLTEQFRWWAIPSDTVRAVAQTPGLLREAVYRPAALTVMRHRMHYMPEQQRLLAKEIAERKVTVDDKTLQSLAPETQARVLELAYDYFNYLRMRGDSQAEASLQHGHELLLTRSRLSVPADLSMPAAPTVRPDEGHRSARAGIGFGRDHGRNFLEIDLRPTYHGLMDDENGYVRGAQTEFFHTRLRLYEAESKVRVEEFTPISIISLSPRDEFFKPISWKAGIGWQRRVAPDGTEPLSLQADVGGGYAWELAPGAPKVSLLYGLLQGSAVLDDAYRDHYVAGIGPIFGWLADVTPHWRSHVTVRLQRFGFDDYHNDREIAMSQRLVLDRQTGLRLDLSHRRLFDDSRSTATFFWYRHF